ncbi:U5 small nuclear ribonucleoprotein 40 kDa protein [Chelonia mydas]|uniref:U5 small nuclear ribonucleoprotein 40 kDa protein n=1 Tax=Chelonia mydas TaxID=8469 RepID=M7BCU2_CHEMY|nr:U5 small nuclear ribonucleoprotein 40 kDa protein [Chelonia mydas]
MGVAGVAPADRAAHRDTWPCLRIGAREEACCCFRELLELWDIRKKAAVQTFQNTYQVLAVTFNDTSDQIISGGIDNDIKVWDLRQNKLTYTMRGHADSVTGLSLSSEGSYLLSNAMDNTESSEMLMVTRWE